MNLWANSKGGSPFQLIPLLMKSYSWKYMFVCMCVQFIWIVNNFVEDLIKCNWNCVDGINWTACFWLTSYFSLHCMTLSHVEFLTYTQFAWGAHLPLWFVVFSFFALLFYILHSAYFKYIEMNCKKYSFYFRTLFFPL